MSLNVLPLVSIAVTGKRGAGRTLVVQAACKIFERLLRKLFPDWTFVYLGSPLGDLPLPNIDPNAPTQFARVLLMEHWAKLYRFVIEVYLPILARVRNGEKIIVLFDGFGWDGLINALAHTKDPRIRKLIKTLHHWLVEQLFLHEEIPPPLYFVLTAADDQIISWMAQKFNGNMQEMIEEDLADFIRLQDEEAWEYFFAPGSHQKAEYLDAGKYSMEQLAQQIFDHVTATIELSMEEAA